MAVINLRINGKKVSKEVPDNTILSDFLRDRLVLTGTHIGCDTSQCGACVVHLNGDSVKSCTTLVADCNGAEITTIEGLAKNGTVVKDKRVNEIKSNFLNKYIYSTIIILILLLVAIFYFVSR